MRRLVLASDVEDQVFGDGVQVGRAAVGYIRVSTHEQVERGMSLGAQRERIEAYCKVHDLDLLSIECDAGISGEYYDKRPGIQTAVQKCREHQAILVSYSLSRISRRLRDILYISEELQAAGADLACITESFDTSHASGRMIFKIFGVIAEFERELICERTRFVLAAKRNKFIKISRYSPYGWKPDAENGELVPDDAEQAMRNRTITLLGSGWHPRKISRHYNREGLRYRDRRSWYAKDIYRILQHALKLGELAYADIKEAKN